MTKHWAAVGEAITQRLRELGLTQLELAAKSHVAPATIREIQYNTQPRRRHPRVLSSLSEALDWPSDHLATVLAGEEAKPRDVQNTLDQILRELHDLKARVEAIEQRQAQHDKPH